MEQVKDANGNINCSNCENCFNCIDCHNCKNCNNCVKCWYLYDCDNCQNISSATRLNGNNTAKFLEGVLNINDTHEVEDYPYGRLRTKVTFGVQYRKGQGFRHLFQSIDPKTGRINKPKNSTYSLFAFNYRDTATGHIKEGSRDYNGNDKINPFCSFIAQHFDQLQLTPEMIKNLYGGLHQSIKIGMGFIKAEDKEQLKALYLPVLKMIAEAYNTGENVFNKIYLPVDEIKKLETL